jgi:hypothetical protein
MPTTTTRRSTGTRKHLLLTKADEAKLPRLRSTDGKADEATVVVKFFSPYSGWRWYAIEGQRVADVRPEGIDGEDDFEFFGWVEGDEKEFGYWMLSDLESATAMNGRLPLVERDKYWRTVPLGMVRSGKVS